jgi:hypothetical protein
VSLPARVFAALALTLNNIFGFCAGMVIAILVFGGRPAELGEAETDTDKCVHDGHQHRGSAPGHLHPAPDFTVSVQENIMHDPA